VANARRLTMALVIGTLGASVFVGSRLIEENIRLGDWIKKQGKRI